MRRTKKDDEQRVMAISFASGRIGYAVFEGMHPLDWGTASFATKDQFAGEVQIAKLLSRYLPHVIMTEKSTGNLYRKGQMAKVLCGVLRRQAKNAGINLQLIDGKQHKAFYGGYGAEGKHEVAEIVCSLIPDFCRRLPPKRRIWESEHRNMVMFEAAALFAPKLV